MNLHREDVKRGIDKAAESLKDAVDRVADGTSASRAKLRERAMQVARKAGDEMIREGRRLRRAAGGEHEALAEGMRPC